MNWIALKMLTGDKPKFFGIVMGLTFAALLITQQGSIFCGLMCRTAGQVTDITGADLWVMDPNVRFVDDVKPMIENNLYRVRSVPGVKWAVPLYKGNGRVKLTPEIRELEKIEPEDSQGRELPPVYRRKIDEYGNPARAKVIEQVILLGLDDATLVGAPPPERIEAGRVEDLRKPDAVMIDYTRLRKLFPGEEWSLEETHRKTASELTPEQRTRFELAYGRIPTDPDGKVNFYSLFLARELEMNDHRAVIVAICEATRTFQSNPVVYTTFSRAKQFIPRERKMLSYILVKIAEEDQHPGTLLDRFIGRIGLPSWLDPKTDALIRSESPGAFIANEIGGWGSERRPETARVTKAILDRTGLKARTRQEFMWDTIGYYLKYTGIPINFGITAALGFLVGTAIAGQTFYNFTLENLKQFGALKAMGATNLRIVGMILLQACVVGLLGYGLGVGLAAWFGLSAGKSELAFYTPWELLPMSGFAIVLICVLASLLCIRRVVVLEPAIVFRG
ncbi:MAG: ABC transporter permease [Isosphaeraceae bacterium]|nr:ABC transporter permease [Isosphaeraceae bacterium]